jgi:diguanylate cyclase (GGDEF)-like protein
MLDASTLLVVLIVSNLLMAGAMWIAFANRFGDGMGEWTAALIVQSLAWTLIYNGAELPGVATPIAYAALACCWSLQVSAILAFHGRRTPRTLLHAPGVAAFILSLAFLQHPLVPLMVGGLAMGAAQFFTGAAMLHYQVAAPRTRCVLAGSFFVMAAALILLALMAWLEPAMVPASASTPVPAPCLFAFYAVTIGSSFAFLLMHKERADREAHKLATTDPLTGVYNRRTFQELATRQLSRCRRERIPLSLLILDLDHFKAVNDTYGHLAGDDVLKAFSQLVSGCLRKEDLLARYGGEEFVILLPGTPEHAAVGLAERIRDLVAATPLRAGARVLNLAVSVGVAAATAAALQSIETMLGRADQALYTAKAQGRNRVIALEDPSRVSLELEPA